MLRKIIRPIQPCHSRPCRPLQAQRPQRLMRTPPGEPAQCIRGMDMAPPGVPTPTGEAGSRYFRGAAAASHGLPGETASAGARSAGGEFREYELSQVCASYISALAVNWPLSGNNVLTQDQTD